MGGKQLNTLTSLSVGKATDQVESYKKFKAQGSRHKGKNNVHVPVP